MALETGASDLQAVETLKLARERILGELRKVIIGQDQVVDQLLTALFANGHVLLVGVPGLAKTLLVSSLARLLDLKFSRIQFTPDLMPSDITGTDIIEDDVATGKRGIRFIRGPVFANLVLADEINRTPPKTQAALLQAMQEKQVTAGGQTFDLALPFFVLATQNPIELEGTYPLPEAQLDRFMFNIYVDYPKQEEEERIVATTTSAYEAKLERVLGAADILELQRLIRRVPVADHVVRYAVRLARATRAGAAADGGSASPDFVRQWVAWGAGPRASQYLVLGAKTRAVLMGRFAPGIEDVKAVALAVLRHRIVTNFTAEAEGIKPDRIIEDLLRTIPGGVTMAESGRSLAGAPAAKIEPLRQIGLYAATAITVGNIIGSGIFRSPHSVAHEVPGVVLPIAAWVLGGILSLCGSLVLAELAVTHPRTGGLYVFIREHFGDAWGFVFGWASLWVIKPTVIAAIASVFALYFAQALHLPASSELALGCGAIMILTLINWLGVKEGAGTAALFTTLKVAGILLLCGAAFLIAPTHPPGPPPTDAAAAGPPPALLLGFVAAMIPVLFAYDGWTDVTYVGGECLNPSRNLPIAIVWGTILVIAIYVITNLAYFRVLSPADVSLYPAVGSETIGRLLGDVGRQGLAVLVAISTFGTVNGAVLTGPRVTQAMADDGLLWKPMAALDSRRGTPSLALWVQAVLSCLWLGVAGGFEDVSGWFVTTSWLFYGLSIAALFIQRRREREGRMPPATYRTPLYPITAWLFILVTVGLIASDLTASGWRAAAGVGIAALGFPVYWVWKGRTRRAAG